MVAAPGSEGGLSFKVAVPLLLLLIAGVFVAAWLDGRRSYAALVPFPNSPEILAGKARDMLVRLGYADPPADIATGFRSDDAGYGAWLNEHDKSATRWQHVASVRPPRVRFWYRTSPRAMTPLNFFGGQQGGGLAVSPIDPPMTEPGMTYLQLDPEGRLVSSTPRSSTGSTRACRPWNQTGPRCSARPAWTCPYSSRRRRSG